MAKDKINKKAVVLLSGGLDSSTVLYYAKQNGYKCFCLFFDYGQKHKKELRSSRIIAKKLSCPLKIVKINLPWTKSSLLNTKIEIPVDSNRLRPPQRGEASPEAGTVLPSTYVPGRNTIFISFALSYAESIGAGTIFIGANAVDYSGYPDCRPGYYRAFNIVLKALGMKIKIDAPLIKLTKAKIVKLALKLKMPYSLTWSCYKGGKKPCGVCDACRFRQKGFQESGILEKY